MRKSKGEKKPRDKKQFRKKLLIVLGSILGVIAAFCLIAMTVTLIGIKANTELTKSFAKVDNPDALIPTVDENGYYTFTTDRELKVMQLTDVHIGGGFMSISKDAKAINAVASMVTAEKPDLVIITGDIAYPVPFQAGTFNNLSSAKLFASLMETLGVYWIPVFGNHDTEIYSYYSREEISEFYSSEEFKYCLYQEGEKDIDGYGNSYITVKNSDGIITQSLFMLDSHSYTDNDYFGIMWKYDNLHQNQIDWYKKTIVDLSDKNVNLINELYKNDEAKRTEALGKYSIVGSLSFFHIPLKEYKTAWNEYVDNGYKNTKDVEFVYGVAGESGEVVYCGMYDDNMFEAMVELGGERGVFCGHDHFNNFSLKYKGVQLTYGYSVDYIAYGGIAKKGSQRGCTIITVKPDGTFSSELSNYYQDKYVNPEKEDITMQDLAADARDN